MTKTQLSPQALSQLVAVTEGTARVGPLVHVPALLKELGVAPETVLCEEGIDPMLLADPENTIGFTPLGSLLTRCAATTGCAHFGLLLGKRSGVDALGLIGLLASHAPNLGTALRDLILHMHLNDRGAVPLLSVEGECAFLGYSVYHPRVESTRHIYDGVMAVVRNVMRTLCGPDWRPSEVIFSHSRPPDLKPFQNHFQASLRFDAPRTGLLFPAHCLKHYLPGSNPKLRRLLEDRVAALEAEGAGDLVAQVRRILHNLVLDGHGSLGEVAQIFAVHRRTLNRRLRERGLTFKRLLDEVRYEIACQLLADTDLSVVELAAVLGYADDTAFSRAFRRWSGSPPTAWRVTSRRA